MAVIVRVITNRTRFQNQERQDVRTATTPSAMCHEHPQGCRPALHPCPNAGAADSALINGRTETIYRLIAGEGVVAV
jgi:hypothetical protein